MNVLLVSPKFHGYENKFIEELNKKNKAYYITTSLNLSVTDRFLARISTNFLKKRYFYFLEDEIKKYKNIIFDRVVVIYGGKWFTKDDFFQLKKAFSSAKFIYYNWDSVINNKQSLEYYKLFDLYFSFDLYDCKKYGYTRIDNWYTFDNEINPTPKYDFGALMNFKEKKLYSYLKIKDLLPSNINGKEYLVMASKGSYTYMKIKHPFLIKKINKYNISKKQLTLEQATNFYNDCKVVIDVPLSYQNGLTTRTFEVLKQEKKLITTNQSIKQYDFYTPNNIFVVDDKIESVPKSFFDTPFDKNYSIGEKYSLSSFIAKLFDLRNE